MIEIKYYKHFRPDPSEIIKNNSGKTNNGLKKTGQVKLVLFKYSLCLCIVYFLLTKNKVPIQPKRKKQ